MIAQEGWYYAIKAMRLHFKSIAPLAQRWNICPVKALPHKQKGYALWLQLQWFAGGKSGV
jgi:hypothetical protein